MLYIFLGFIFGFTIPYLARRFAKFMPATPGYALYRIFHINKHVSKQKRLTNRTYLKLRTHYFMRSFGWGVVTSTVLFIFAQNIPAFEMPWIAFFIIVSFALMEIDKRMFLLPDILTVPLLIGGFAYASFAGDLLNNSPLFSVENSALGATFGYILPVIASLCLVKKHPDAFGGGDIKLLAGVGAWFGVENIAYIILLSCAVFAISCFIKKQRIGAFGPSIVISSLIVLFCLEY
jgi:prepilin signal peptidase PulO-like enzyme (type II secretory pathway)